MITNDTWWGKYREKIVKHLKENFCDDEETEEGIIKQYKKLNVKYDPADLVQVYFKELHDAKTILLSLQDTVTYKVLIPQSIYRFNKHIDFNKAIHEKKSRLITH